MHRLVYLAPSLLVIAWACGDDGQVGPTAAGGSSAGGSSAGGSSAGGAAAGGASAGGASSGGGLNVDPFCSGDDWCWSNPLPHGYQLQAVWASDSGGAWVAGRRYLSFDGTDWATVPGPTGASLDDCRDLWGSADDDVWGASFGSEHWDGSSWESLSPFILANAVWGSASDDVWMGGFSDTTISHFDGTSWSEVPLSSENAFIEGIWGASPDDVWAVGWNNASQASMFHWDGASWSPVTAPVVDELTGVWGVAADDVWAVGHHGTVIHWDGSQWTSVGPATNFHLYDVWGAASDDFWAVGAGGTLLHYDGSAWLEHTTDAARQLVSIHGTSADRVVAVGPQGRVLQYDGSTWQGVGGGLYRLDLVHDFWGSAADDVWAVVQQGLAHYDGVTWEQVESSFEPYRALWGFGANDVWLVGEEAVVKHWNGSTWSDVATGLGGDDDVTGVWGAASDDLWVVTTGGDALHWDGNGFSSLSTGVPLLAIHGCADAPDGNTWAVGGSFTSPAIVRWTGSEWTETPTPASTTSDGFVDVYCRGADDAWAATDDEVLHWDGAAWSVVYTSVASLQALTGDAEGNIWIAGAIGRIQRWDGTAWSMVDSDTTYTLRALWSGHGTVWAGGELSTILRHDF